MARRTKAVPPRRGPARPAAPTGARRQGPARAQSGALHPATQAELDRLDRLADLLDSRFRIPGIGWRFGLDSVIGLIPGVGDVAALGPSAYLIYQGHRLGADKATLGKMAVNSGLDFAVGTIPVLGDLFDVGFKANRRNIDLLKRDVVSRAGASSKAPPRR